MIWVFIFVFASYFFCMMALVYGFRKIPFFTSKQKDSLTYFSLIIPFRNEDENLRNLLSSIENLNYPAELFEIIFVNDASEDNSEAIVNSAIEKSKFSITLIQNNRVSNSPKKDAISEAIKNSNFEWIVTSDADCELPENWLKTLDAFICINNPIMVCGPVVYQSNGDLIENFQQLDGLSLQAVSLGSFGVKNPLLCNGANLAYSKRAFYEVNGFSGNDHIASGDDIFLMEKLKKAFPEKVQYLKSKEGIVSTKPQQTWKNLINQRVRWASKTSKQKNPASIFLGFIVLLANISLLSIPYFMVFTTEGFSLYLLLIIFKITVDYIVIWQAAHFLNVKFSFLKFIWQPFLYAVVMIIVILRSFDGSYFWKDREFQNP